jgi:regulator of sirC expression with transglutaminase-like and TPR domain
MDGFTRLATGGCPPLADLLLALAAEFRDVDAAAADARLDDLALPLFGLGGGDLRTAAARLATVLDTEPGFDADRVSVAGLWLDSALEARSGHPLVLAALIAEVGRRAGLPTHVLSAPTGWYAGLADGERLWLIDATMNGGRADPWSLRRHCAHEVGFAALIGLSERFERLGDRRRAGRATLLRSRLPLKGARPL